MAEQQDHNSGGEDTDGDGQHRRQGRHTSTSSTAQTTRAKIHQVLCQKMNLTKNSYI
jgi:hypothetical protein